MTTEELLSVDKGIDKARCLLTELLTKLENEEDLFLLVCIQELKQTIGHIARAEFVVEELIEVNNECQGKDSQREQKKC